MKKTTRSLMVVLLGFVLLFALSAPVALIYTDQTGAPAAQRASLKPEAAAPGGPQASAPPETGQTPQAPAVVSAAPAGHPGAKLKVKNILQNPEMPNGCEAVSLAILLNHLGFQTAGKPLFDNCFDHEGFTYETVTAYGPDPESAYPGLPYEDGLGFYCYPGVVVKAANRFLAGQPGTYYAFDTTGMGEEGILTSLDEGTPVIAWVTRDGEPPRYNKKFVWTIENTAERYRPYANLHVLVVTGYDADYLYLSDPLGNYEKMERDLFFQLHRQMGMRSVVVRQAVSSDHPIS